MMTTSVASSAQRLSDHPVMSGIARFGMAARAVVYLLIGWLALDIALGHPKQQANQRGALADVADHSFGIVLLWILSVGFAAYALWKLTEAATGPVAEKTGAGPRLRAFASGVAYLALCATTFSFIAGRSTQGQAQQQATLTGRLMRHSDGRWLVGLIGVVVAIIGLAMAYEGVRRTFAKKLRLGDMRGRTRTVVVGLGVAGTVARGLVFALVGALVVDAAVTFDPAKSTGLDGALRTLANRAYGPELLGVTAAGLLAFGLYGFAEARWARTRG